MIAHCHADLFKLPCTGLRFFTVYGPLGRSDMALFKFTKALIVVDTVKAKLPGAAIDVKSVLDADAVRAGGRQILAVIALPMAGEN